MRIKFPVTAFCVAQPGCVCRWVVLLLYLLQSLSVPRKYCMYTQWHFSCTPVFWNAFLCPSPFPHALDRSALWWILSHAPKVPNSLSHSLPGPCPAPSHYSTTALQDLFPRSSAMRDIKLFLLGTEKDAAGGRSALPPPPALQSSCNHRSGKAEWGRGEHRENKCNGSL